MILIGGWREIQLKKKMANCQSETVPKRNEIPPNCKEMILQLTPLPWGAVLINSD